MKNKYVQIENANMVRDITNMSLINNDINELQEYLNKRNFLVQQKNEINNMKQELNELKSDISEIKELLLKNLKG